MPALQPEHQFSLTAAVQRLDNRATIYQLWLHIRDTLVSNRLSPAHPARMSDVAVRLRYPLAVVFARKRVDGPRVADASVAAPFGRTPAGITMDARWSSSSSGQSSTRRARSSCGGSCTKPTKPRTQRCAHSDWGLSRGDGPSSNLYLPAVYCHRHDALRWCIAARKKSRAQGSPRAKSRHTTASNASCAIRPRLATPCIHSHTPCWQRQLHGATGRPSRSSTAASIRQAHSPVRFSTDERLCRVRTQGRGVVLARRRGRRSGWDWRSGLNRAHWFREPPPVRAHRGPWPHMVTQPGHGVEPAGRFPQTAGTPHVSSREHRHCSPAPPDRACAVFPATVPPARRGTDRPARGAFKIASQKVERD